MSLDMTIDNIIFSPALPEASRPRIEGTNSLKVVSPSTKFTGAVTIDGNVGIGITTTPVEKLEIGGNLKVTGDSIKNFQGLRIIETNKSDWLRINPDQTYPAIALHKPVAIGTGGLAVGEFSQLPQGQLKVTSSAFLATNGGNVGIGTVTPNPNVKLDVEGGAYLGYANSITDFGGILKSGFYQGTGAITGDVPDTSHDWSHLLVIRHSNTGNNHQLQIAGTYGVNDRLFFRKIAAGLVSNNPTWNELATRGPNLFTGNQVIAGKLDVKGRIKDQTGYLVPVGSILAYMGSNAPEGWLLCDGRQIPADAIYAELRGLIGPYTPNLCLRTIIGAGTNNEIGNFNIPLKNKGGEWAHTLSLNEIPNHAHGYHGPFDNYGHRDGGTDWTRYGRDSRPNNGTTSAEGGNQPHNNVQPYYALNYIIKY